MKEKTFILNLTPELHTQLKISAAEKKITMADLIREAIKNYLGK